MNSDWITHLLSDPSASVRRQAATTLGRLGDASCVVSLIQSLGRENIDRSEEHAIIYALIEIGDAEAIRSGMRSQIAKDGWNTSMLGGLVLSLDQIDGSEVKFEEFKIGLQTEDESTLRTVAQIAKKHPEWSEQVAEIVRTSMSDQEGPLSALLESLLASFVGSEPVAEVAGEVLSEPKYESDYKKLVMKAIADTGKMDPHAGWINPLRAQLTGRDDELVMDAIAAVSSLSGNHFSDQLRAIADDSQRSITVRMGALGAVVTQSGSLDDATLQRLIELYQNSGSPTASSRAAQIIGSASLTKAQLLLVVPLLEVASTAELRDLFGAFQRRMDLATATRFLDAFETSDAWMSLAEHELSEAIKRFPPETLDRANRMLDQLRLLHQQKLSRLETLRAKLLQGDASRGELVFASEKAKCRSCHRVGEKGAAVGPDLTTIGANRSASDLLESIVFPSASIVRDYESWKVLTTDGRALTGLVTKESASEIHLQLVNGEVVQLRHTDIEQIVPSTVSIMPAGLEDALSEQELLDVVSYLQRLSF